jgi:hypothetical protein
MVRWWPRLLLTLGRAPLQTHISEVVSNPLYVAIVPTCTQLIVVTSDFMGKKFNLEINTSHSLNVYLAFFMLYRKNVI